MKQPSETTPEGRAAGVEEVMADEADVNELEIDAGVTTGVADEPADDEETLELPVRSLAPQIPELATAAPTLPFI